MTSDLSASDAELTPDRVIDLTAQPILEYGRGWMSAPTTGARAEGLGLAPGFGFWVNGRAGVLGDVDPDVAAAAIGFMSPDAVRSMWGAYRSDLSPIDLTTAYAEAAADWARTVLGDADLADLERLAELCDKVTAAALPSCGLLFAGWRALDQGSDPVARVTVALNVLREHRGGAHLSAVHAVGLGPLGAIMSTDDPVRGGQPWAERFGWTGPFPAADVKARAEAERLTSVICRPAYEVLDQDERRDFVSLVQQARAALDA